MDITVHNNPQRCKDFYENAGKLDDGSRRNRGKLIKSLLQWV